MKTPVCRYLPLCTFVDWGKMCIRDRYIQNAGTDGAKRDAILEYLQGTLPSRNTNEQNTILVKNIMTEMKNESTIFTDGRLWYSVENYPQNRG